MSTESMKARPAWLRESAYVLAAVLVGLGVAMALNSVMNGAVVERARRDVSRTLEHLSRHVLETEESGGDLAAALGREAQVLGIRLTLIAPDGRVLADSNVDPRRLAAVENHGSRPEILAARTSGIGFDRRLSATVAEPFLYVAYRLDRGGNLAGYLRGAVGENDIRRLEEPFRRRLTAVAILTGFLAGLLLLAIRRRHFDELHLLRESVKRASLGELAGVKAQTSADSAEILASLADLVRRVRLGEEKTKSLEVLLDTVLERIGDGVLVVRRDLSLIRANSAAATVLKASPGSFRHGAHILEAYRDSRLAAAFEEALGGEAQVELGLEVAGERIAVRITGFGAGEARHALAVLARG
ncbi:MAG: hypothetical protein DIJKHBIC_01291 [Thermoanaerobaculia bacterium]|nr:hypothetical protein [Thermoanaerobaculia bacterium]